MASTLRETISVSAIAPDIYQSEPYFENARTGDMLPWAYGGLAVAQCISAGAMTVPETSGPHFQLYSVQGTFLGPASTEVPTTYEVTDIRTTRTFCSRLVQATQRIDDDKRKVMIVMMDWHMQEPITLFDYSLPPLNPLQSYPNPDDPDLSDIEGNVKKGLPPKLATVAMKFFHFSQDFFENRLIKSSMATQNLVGFRGPDAVTSQDDLPMTRRSNFMWCKAKEVLQSETENIAALALNLDGQLPHIPLGFTNRTVYDIASMASLDFSFRIFRPVDLSKYHLLEQHTECGANARTFNISRVYDRDGREVAQMNQISIIRPLEGEGSPSSGTDPVGGSSGLSNAVEKGTGARPRRKKGRLAKL